MIEDDPMVWYRTLAGYALCMMGQAAEFFTFPNLTTCNFAAFKPTKSHRTRLERHETLKNMKYSAERPSHRFLGQLVG